MTTTENNVAAQAGDEPMRAALNAEIAMLRKALEYYADPKTNAPGAVARDALAASPRATADVARESANALLEELLILEAQENIARSDGNGEGITTKRFDSLTARVAQYLATTKPGA